MKWCMVSLLAAVLLACGEEERTRPAAAEEPVTRASSWVEPTVEPVEAEVFMRRPVPDAGSRRLLLHVLVPTGSTEAQIRQALVDVMTRTAEEDTTVVALRAVAYVLPRAQAGEVELAPSGWGEWLPPQGWASATIASRREFHRTYTYFGTPPAW